MLGLEGGPEVNRNAEIKKFFTKAKKDAELCAILGDAEDIEDITEIAHRYGRDFTNEDFSGARAESMEAMAIAESMGTLDDDMMSGFAGGVWNPPSDNPLTRIGTDAWKAYWSRLAAEG